MKWTKQQKVLSGVMIAGLFAVAADRLVSRGNSADAAMINDASEVAIVKAPQAVIPQAKTAAFSERLAAAACGASATRGAFELGSVWQVPQTAAAPVIDPAIETFTNAHKLSVTLARGEHAGAVIDGKLCVIGQTVDGFRLLTVTGRTATFTNGRSRVTLMQTAR